MQLPFLVVHAALVWKVVLVAFVALCVTAFLAIRYALVRAGNRAAERELDTTDEGVVRGTLRGGIASTLYIASTYGMAKQPRFHAGDLVIETADGDVALDGDIRVAAGSRVAARRRHLPESTPEELAKLHRDATDSTIATAVLHQVHPGDEVIAKGTLVHEAGSAATDYRENATRRVLRGSIAIAARAPMTKVVRPSLPVLAVVLGVSAFAGYKIEGLCGDAWAETCRAGGDVDLTNGNACVMANAMPGSNDTLDTLLQQLDHQATPGEATLQERIALSRLVENCRSALQRLQRIDRPELAIAEARRCGDFEAQEIALAELGRFDDAAAVPVLLGGYRTEVRGRILVLAGAWRPAAAYAEQRAAELRSQPAEADPDRRDRIAADVVAWQCIAALMQYYADGSATAVARIHELAAGPHGGQCAPELAEAGSADERARVLGSSHDLVAPWRAIEVERQLAGLGMMNDHGVPAALLEGSDSLGMTYGPALWATRIAPPIPDHAPLEQRFTDATNRLAIAVWMRDFASAHRYADLAIELGRDQLAGYDAQFTSLFHPMIDLYTAKTPLDVPPPPVREDPATDDPLVGIWAFMTPRLAIRHGGPFETRTFVQSKEMENAMRAAQQGDGAALARMLGEEGIWPLDLIAVLPMIKTHREEVQRALPWMPV
ncbi:MAG TPA: hypothetical protein VFQ65_34670, partial [Kofleriaceae bacterium]|nr:hypothetical protein [Kofleriaceae bacterium]